VDLTRVVESKLLRCKRVAEEDESWRRGRFFDPQWHRMVRGEPGGDRLAGPRFDVRAGAGRCSRRPASSSLMKQVVGVGVSAGVRERRCAVGAGDDLATRPVRGEAADVIVAAGGAT